SCSNNSCDLYHYQTVSNSCVAGRENALVSFQGECENLEDEATEAPLPVVIHQSTEDLPDNASGIERLSSDIEGHSLTLELRHAGGCGEHDFNLHTALPFRESQPLQIDASLTHDTEDSCEALITNTVVVDLQPLAEIYRQQYQSTSGEIYIGDFGLYQF